MKALLDTCIIIDALQSREPFAKEAQNIFLAAATRQCEAYITAKEVTDIYYLTRHATHSKVQTEQIMSKLFELFPVLDTSAEDVQQAVVLKMPDYEDAVMTRTAVRENMDCIVTRNLKDYKNAIIKVYSPGKFLEAVGYHA